MNTSCIASVYFYCESVAASVWAPAKGNHNEEGENVPTGQNTYKNQNVPRDKMMLNIKMSQRDKFDKLFTF